MRAREADSYSAYHPVFTGFSEGWPHILILIRMLSDAYPMSDDGQESIGLYGDRRPGTYPAADRCLKR